MGHMDVVSVVGRRWSPVVAVGVWVGVGMDALGVDWVSEEMARTLLALSVVLAVGWLLVRLRLPVEDVWQAGREHGRREVMRELSERPVLSLSAHRRRRRESLPGMGRAAP